MKKKRILSILLAVAMVICAMPASIFAGDDPVAKIGETEYDTLQAAIDAASDGDVIEVTGELSETKVTVVDKIVFLKKLPEAVSVDAECEVSATNPENTGVLFGDLEKAVKYVSDHGNTGFTHPDSAGWENNIFFFIKNDIKLTDDIVLPPHGNTNSVLYYDVSHGKKEFQLDLNGHKISQKRGGVGGYWWASIDVFDGAKLIIEDSSANGTGEISGIASCIVMQNGGQVILNSGKLSEIGDADYDGNGIVKVRGKSKFIMNGGKISGSSATSLLRAAIEYTNAGDTPSVLINDGFISAVAESNCSSGTTYKSPDGFVWHSSGGTFDFSIKGGYFNFDPSNYVDEGYEAVSISESSIGDDKTAFDDGYGYKVVMKEIAKIGNTIYPSLASAIAAVPADGTKTTIKMLADETFADNANMTISANQNIVLDLNDKTVTGKNIQADSWAFFTNEGILTITDTSAKKDGKITSMTVPDCQNMAGHYTVLNKNIMTLNEGTIEETSEQVGGGPYNLKWALRNEASANQRVSLTINGGLVIGEYNAISNYVYDNTSVCNMTINDGQIITNGRFSPVTMQIASGTKPNMNIKIAGGEFITKNINNKNDNGNATIYCDDQSKSVTNTANLKISITGGKFNTYNTGMIVQFDDFKTETVTPSGYVKAGYISNAIDAKEIISSCTCAALSNQPEADGYDEDYDALTGVGYKYKVTLLKAPTSETKYIVTYEDDQGQIEYHSSSGAAVEAAKESTKKVTITVSEGGITADIDDTVIIVANTGAGIENHVTADPGYVLNDGEEDTTAQTVKYTASELAISYVDKEGTTTGSGVIEAKQTSAKTVITDAEVTTAVQNIAADVTEEKETVEDTTEIQTAAQKVADTIKQGTAAKALAQGTNLVVKNEDTSESGECTASNISVFVDTYYQTQVTEDKTTETVPAQQSFTLDIKPMYQAYATTLVVTDATTMDNITPTIGTSSAAIGSPKELDMTGKMVTMKVKLPAGFVTSTSDTVYVMHTKDGQDPKYYTATVGKESEDFFAVFTNPDGFSEFTFSRESLEPAPPTPPTGGGGSSTPVVKKACPQDENCVYAKYTDSDTKAWYHDGVHFCVEKGYMIGVDTDRFAPADNLSRAMIVTMLWRMEGSSVVNYAMSFEDVASEQWYTEAVRWAQSTKIVEGYSSEVFGPEDNVTREQVATILMRYATYKGIAVSKKADLVKYTDVKSISNWALDSIKWANAVGIINGRTDTTIAPTGESSRAEAACMFQRFCETVLEK